MRNILLLGAGRSSAYLIQYLLEQAQSEGWMLTVGDVSEELALKKTGGHKAARAIRFDLFKEEQLSLEIGKADLIISLLPPHLHILVAKECVNQKRHLVTASYVNDEMQNLHKEALSQDVLLLNECGLDPGIDHMSAMQMIDAIKSNGGELLSFKSYTGGLVAPESNDNPWGYKFSWNPRNVILAGQGTARFIENGKYKYIPYNRLFSSSEEVIIEGHGIFDAYANRDSLSYRKIYKIEKIPTMLRGTLRQQHFCKAWHIFVTLGLTDDTFVVEHSEHLTYAQLIEAFLPVSKSSATIKQRVAAFTGLQENDQAMQMIEWTGVFGNQVIGMKDATPAQILQRLLESKWKLNSEDKDMIVMQHEFEYTSGSKKNKMISSLVVTGENETYTAMAKTVGLPAAIAAKNILKGKIKLRGVQVPVHEEIYKPVLEELKKYGVNFKELVQELV